MYVLLLAPILSSLNIRVDMIIDNDPPITRNISVPRDMSQLSCSSFTAGIVEAVLDGLGFVSRARLSPRHPLVDHTYIHLRLPNPNTCANLT